MIVRTVRAPPREWHPFFNSSPREDRSHAANAKLARAGRLDRTQQACTNDQSETKRRFACPDRRTPLAPSICPERRWTAARERRIRIGVSRGGKGTGRGGRGDIQEWIPGMADHRGGGRAGGGRRGRCLGNGGCLAGLADALRERA